MSTTVHPSTASTGPEVTAGTLGLVRAARGA